MSDTPILKYLFKAFFSDGTVIEQMQDDKGYSPNARNAYSDVLYAQSLGKKLVKFVVDNGNSRASVDLLTGIFRVNDFPVLLESEKLPALPDHFDLIWYHQVTRDLKVTYDKKTGEELKREPMPEFREYFIGWECEINGKKYTQKLAVS